jgi:hypothetical protein
MLRAVVRSQPPVPETEDGCTTSGSSGRTAPLPIRRHRTGVYAWRPGDTIPLGATRTLRVVEVRRDEHDEPPVLVVEDLPGSVTSADAVGHRSLHSWAGPIGGVPAPAAVGKRRRVGDLGIMHLLDNFAVGQELVAVTALPALVAVRVHALDGLPTVAQHSTAQTQAGHASDDTTSPREEAVAVRARAWIDPL